MSDLLTVLSSSSSEEDLCAKYLRASFPLYLAERDAFDNLVTSYLKASEKQAVRIYSYMYIYIYKYTDQNYKRNISVLPHFL